MTIIERLAREAAPCLTERVLKCNCPDMFGRSCERCRLRPAIEAKMRELVEACAVRSTEHSDGIMLEEIADSIRALTTDEDPT